MALSITWIGHGTFLIVTPGGKRIFVDPFFGPTAPASLNKPESVLPLDAILVTHGHVDHITDLIATARASNAPVVCIFDMGLWLGTKGLKNVKDKSEMKISFSGGVLEMHCAYGLRLDGVYQDGPIYKAVSDGL